MFLKNPYLGDYKITSGYGDRVHPVTGINKMHNGVDIALPEFTQIIAPISGVCYLGENEFAGKYISLNAITEQGIKIQLIFCHLSKFLVEDSENVLINSSIALSGNTGMSTGSHLHFSVKIFDPEKQEYLFIDPLEYFNFGVA